MAAGALALAPGLAAAATDAWSLPVPFSAPGRVLPSEPAVAVAPEGRAVVAWWRTDAAPAPLRDVVQIRTRANATAPFLGPRTVSARRDDTTQPVAAAAAGRRTLMGWTDDRGAVALTLPRGARRPPVTLLAEGAGARIQDLRVAIAPTGAAIAVWIRADPAPTLRIARRAAATGAWSAPADLGPPGAAHPGVAMAGDGAGLVAWERPGGLDIAPVAPDGTLGAATPLPGAGAAARRPAVAMNAAGDALVAWWEAGVVAAGRPAGGAFGAPVAISAAAGAPPRPRAPEVALSAARTATAAWLRVDGGRARVEGAVGALDGRWQPVTVLSPPAARNAGRPSLAGAANGAAAVAWSQPVGRSAAAIRARIVGRGATAFGPVEAVSAPGGRGTAPTVGIDGAGRAVVAWREDPVGGAGRSFRGAVRRAIG